MTKWSELLNLKIVPKDIRDFEEENCRQYNKAAFAYTNKTYKPTYQCQLDLNAYIDETEILNLVLNNQEFRDSLNISINNYLSKSAELKENLQQTKRLVSKTYHHNTFHGLADREIPTFADLEIDKWETWADILCDEPDSEVSFKLLEVKSTVSYSKYQFTEYTSENYHKADLVFLHYLDTKVLRAFLRVFNKSRNDFCYIKLDWYWPTNFNNKRINQDWSISKF